MHGKRAVYNTMGKAVAICCYITAFMIATVARSGRRTAGLTSCSATYAARLAPRALLVSVKCVVHETQHP